MTWTLCWRYYFKTFTWHQPSHPCRRPWPSRLRCHPWSSRRWSSCSCSVHRTLVHSCYGPLQPRRWQCSRTSVGGCQDLSPWWPPVMDKQCKSPVTQGNSSHAIRCVRLMRCMWHSGYTGVSSSDNATSGLKIRHVRIWGDVAPPSLATQHKRLHGTISYRQRVACDELPRVTGPLVNQKWRKKCTTKIPTTFIITSTLKTQDVSNTGFFNIW